MAGEEAWNLQLGSRVQRWQWRERSSGVFASVSQFSGSSGCFITILCVFVLQVIALVLPVLQSPSCFNELNRGSKKGK